MNTPPRHTEKARLAHDALCVAQELVRRTQQRFLASQNKLQAITVEHDQTEADYRQAKDKFDSLQNNVTTLKQHLDQYLNEVNRQCDLNHQATQAYLDVLQTFTEDPQTLNKRDALGDFDYHQQNFQQARNQWANAQNNYQAALIAQNQATSEITLKKQQYDALCQSKQKITAKHNYFAGTLTVLKKNLQQAEAHYEQCSRSPRYLHPNIPSHSNASIFSEPSTTSSTSTFSINFNNHESTKSVNSFNDDFLLNIFPPNAMTLRLLTSTNSLPDSRLLKNHRLQDACCNLSPSKFLNIENS